MNGFYVSMIFLGVLLVLISLLLIILDKKKVFNFTKSFDEKKQELTEILSDAEQMIEELNKFSDYIVSQMDLKSEELNKNLKAAEDKVSALSEHVKSMNCKNYTSSVIDVAVGGEESPAKMLASAQVSASKAREAETGTGGAEAAAGYKKCGYRADCGTADAGHAETAVPEKTEKHTSATAKKKEKIIPFSSKYSEVLKLAEQGMDSLDIARGLNMGKGEVELIIGLHR